MKRTTADEVLMVRPIRFEYNPQTALNNNFQVQGDPDESNRKAIQEFDSYAEQLRAAGIKVNVIQDTELPHTPDSIFPNNWFTTHNHGHLVFYPLFAENRRTERKEAVVSFLKSRYPRFHDMTGFEQRDKFLEGTGSMVLDRQNRIVYVCRSIRSSREVFDEFCKLSDYRGVFFNAYDRENVPIYHTNVMMALGRRFVFIALCSITDEKERETVRKSLAHSGKFIVELTQEQISHYAGNMLELTNDKGESVLVLSDCAYHALNKTQQALIQNNFDHLVIPKLPYIEGNGGGSARCMIAELF